MAAGDYRSCDVCGGKAFYDAALDYGNDNRPSYRIAGVAQYEDPELDAAFGATLGYVGDWAVICLDCAKTHRTAILPIEEIAASQAAKTETKE